MTAPARIAFAVLVCATFAAFFVAQKLKSAPPRVQDLKVLEFFSPNRDGRFDRTRVAFFLKRADDVTATVIDGEGDAVRRLVDNRPLAKGERVSIPWDGRNERGRIAPDGTYRVRLNLRREGRSVTLPRNIRLDTTPPELLVTSIGPQRNTAPRPELLPRADGRPARVTFQAAGARRREVHVFRTDVRPARPVFDTPVKLADDATSWEWDGTADGRRVAAGTYVVVIRARDQAGNIGSSARLPPSFQFREALPGRGGITVRYLTAQGSTSPVKAGEPAAVAVDSVDRNFSWSVRRIGESRVRTDGRGTQSRLVRFTAPGDKSGLYVFEVRTRSRRTATPVVVQSQRQRDVLVVLPVTTWQGLNPYDDDGDGRPNTLSAGLPVRVTRPYVKDGLPGQIRRDEALLLTQLDRKRHRYDLTTDLALGRGEGRRLADYRGVILAGDTRWLDTATARALRAYVRGGGRLLSVGTKSLRRTVTLTPRGRAIDPTLPTQRDLFGARLKPIAPGPLTLVNVVDDIDLFAGTEGQFPGIPAVEETIDVRGGAAAIAAAAAAEDGRRQVIVASRLGDGLVVRPGMPEFSAGLKTSPELAALLESAWKLLEAPVIAAASTLGETAQTAGVIVAALLAAAVLLARSARARACAMLGAIVLTPVLLVSNIWSTPQFEPLRNRPVVLLAGGAVALVVLALGAWAIHGRPALLALAAAAALPFRVPIESGGDTANLLVPLYLVIAAGVVAYAVPRLGSAGRRESDERDRGLLDWLLAGTLVLYAVQAAYSSDFDNALAQVIFFYVPFALLYALLRRMQWTTRLAGRALGVLLALAVAFAGIGFVEFATRELLLNPKVISSNQFESYFRVNSLFFDPNIYGRFLAVVMLGLVAVALWSRRGALVAGCAAALACLWAGLVLTLSQSSFTALLAGLVVLGGLRWGGRKAAAVVAAFVVAGAVVALAAPGAVGLKGSTDAATSGRSTLVSGGVELFTGRPLQGWGAGSFKAEYRRQQKSSSQRASAASHTIPITVAAEQGIGGLILYLALVVVATLGLLRGARSSVARAAVAAGFVALVVHTLLYAAFLEDPLVWALLAVGAALPRAARERDGEPRGPDGAAAADVLPLPARERDGEPRGPDGAAAADAPAAPAP